MPAIVWDSSLEIGIQMLDEQHKELFRRADKLYNALSGQPDKMAVKEILQFLIEYVEKHFTAEEKAMEFFAYPGLAAHASEHGELTKQIHELAEEFINSGDVAVAGGLGGLVFQWMTRHIKMSDLKFSQFIKMRDRISEFTRFEE